MPVKQGREGVRQEMRKFKEGSLHSGSKTGPVVTNRKQAIAIALHEAGMSGRAEGGEVNARLKRAPERELPMTYRRAPIDPKWEQMPSSPNIEDRRGEWGQALVEQAVAPTGYNTAEWRTLLRHPLTSTKETLPHRYAQGGGLRMPRLSMPRPKGFRGFKHLDSGGFISSDVPGRTDKHYVTVQSGSYVLPADHVSALGQNNSNAGANVVREMFGTGSKFGPRLRVPKFAGGGSVEPVPIVVAGGEMILPPNIVRRIGNGDLEKGHEVLDKWVMETRNKHISKLKSLKPPKGSDGK